MPHVNKKPLARKGNLVQTKNQTYNELRMNWENHLENPIQKIEKNSKTQSEFATCEQKSTSKKANFCSNTACSLYFKINVKITPQNHSLSRSTSCFSVTKITTHDFKNHKNVSRDLKKTAPQYNSNFSN